MTGWFAQIRPRLERLYDIPKPRLPRKLSPEQLANLREDLMVDLQKHRFESEMQTGKMILKHVRRKCNIEYVPHTMQHLRYFKNIKNA